MNKGRITQYEAALNSSYERRKLIRKYKNKEFEKVVQQARLDSLKKIVNMKRYDGLE